MLLSEFVNNCTDKNLVDHINRCITCQDEFELLNQEENENWIILNVKGLKAKEPAKLCIKKES